MQILIIIKSIRQLWRHRHKGVQEGSGMGYKYLILILIGLLLRWLNWILPYGCDNARQLIWKLLRFVQFYQIPPRWSIRKWGKCQKQEILLKGRMIKRLRSLSWWICTTIILKNTFNMRGPLYVLSNDNAQRLIHAQSQHQSVFLKDSDRLLFKKLPFRQNVINIKEKMYLG